MFRSSRWADSIPLQSAARDATAESFVTPMQVTLAWLLQRSPNVLLIPGTSSVEQLRENLQAAPIKLCLRRRSPN